MEKNITIANIENGTIVTKNLVGQSIPEDLVRDGWVEVASSDIPYFRVVIEGGELYKLFSSLPAVRVRVTDLDTEPNPNKIKKELCKSNGLMHEIPFT